MMPTTPPSRRPSRGLFPLLATLLAACLWGCDSHTGSYSGQMVFDTPEAAVERFAAAVRTGDPAEFEAIFGAEARETLSTGDPVADRRQREVVGVAMGERWTLERKGSKDRELVIGNEAWPFPIPIVKDGRGWWFDTAAGREEILIRRIGRNELATLRTLRTYAAVQREYAEAEHDGRPSGIYARQIRSDPGAHNGLYWPPSDTSEAESPLGEFIAAASAEGYRTESEEGTVPFHGYYYRILTSQGPAAQGGAMDYVVDGEMTRGFAMIAYPAMYGSSGVMTFLIGPDGIVYESDLGSATVDEARALNSFDPGEHWRAVE